MDRQNKFKFNEIPSDTLKNKIEKLLIDKYTIRFENDPVKCYEEHLKKKNRLSLKGWRRLCWITMCNIDKERDKLGLSPIYNCK